MESIRRENHLVVKDTNEVPSAVLFDPERVVGCRRIEGREVRPTFGFVELEKVVLRLVGCDLVIRSLGEQEGGGALELVASPCVRSNVRV